MGTVQVGEVIGERGGEAVAEDLISGLEQGDGLAGLGGI